jgi:hypothetical protein
MYARTEFKCISCSSGDNIEKAWYEADRTAPSTGHIREFEPGQPDAPYGGEGQTNFTVGFGVGLNASLGYPPVSVGGDVSAEWSIRLSTSTENYHPIAREKHASGGAMWCRYQGSSNATKMLPERESVRVSDGYGVNWHMWHGQSDSSSGCPTQQ